MTEKNIEIIGSSILKQKLKAIADKNNENDNIRLHRAISWIKCAEEHSDNIDLKFITLWISFNACYADNDNYNISLTEIASLQNSLTLPSFLIMNFDNG